MSDIETVCTLSKGTGDKKEFIKCQPIDAKDHMKNGWLLESKPRHVGMVVSVKPQEEVVEEKQAKKSEAKKADNKKGESSVIFTGEEEINLNGKDKIEDQPKNGL